MDHTLLLLISKLVQVIRFNPAMDHTLLLLIPKLAQVIKFIELKLAEALNVAENEQLVMVLNNGQVRMSSLPWLVVQQWTGEQRVMVLNTGQVRMAWFMVVGLWL